MRPAPKPAVLLALIAVGTFVVLPSSGATATPGPYVDPLAAVAIATPLPESYALVDVWPPQIPTGALLFHPTGIAVDESGRVVVVEAGNGRVTRARTTGEGFVPNTPPVRFGQPGSAEGDLASPEDVAVSADGSRIYVADTGNRRIQVFSPAGDVLAVWNNVGEPRGIALGPQPSGEPGGSAVPDALVYLSDVDSNVIRVFSADGLPVASWGGPVNGSTEFDTPLGLTVDPEGDLVVADHGHQRLVWLDADASEGDAGAVVGVLPLDNSRGPGGAPLDVGVDLTGEVYAAVDRAILRFTDGETVGSAGGTGRAAGLSFSAAVPPVAEIIGPPCNPGQCQPKNPRALGCYLRVALTDSHEGIRRIDLRPDVGLYVTYAPQTRSPDRVIVYPALRGGAPGGFTRADDQGVIVWPRHCRDFGGPSLRHTTDPERIAAAPDSYGARTLDTSGTQHVWHADGRLYDTTTAFPITTGEDLAVSAALPAVTGVVTGNQVRFGSLRCFSGGGDDVCPPEKIDVLDARQLLRHNKTNECRASEPIPWRPGTPAPCIPDEAWWIVADAANGGTRAPVQRETGGVLAPHDMAIAALDASGPRVVVRTLWVGPPLGEQALLSGVVQLTAATAPFDAWSDLAYDSQGGLAALARAGRLRVVDDHGRNRGEVMLEGLAPRTAESLGIDPNGGIFVLTGDGWVMKYAPEAGTAPQPSGTPARALLRAAWRLADLAGPGRYRDLAVSPDGRVMVPDADGDRVLVFAPAAGTPPLPPPVEDTCQFVPDKYALPDRLMLGETTNVTLRLDGGCDAPLRDIVVVLDASCQLSGDRLRYTREGLAEVATVLADPSVRLGVVTFNNGLGDARLALPLTADRTEVEAFASAFTTNCVVDFACVEARRGMPHVGTFLWPYGCATDARIADGLRAGREALLSPGSRPTAEKSMILVSPSLFDVQRTLAILAAEPDTFDPPMDPFEQARWNSERAQFYAIPPQGDRELAMREAWLLRDAGVNVWAVSAGQDSYGAGHPPDDALLAAIANPANGFAAAMVPSDLPIVLSRIADSLAEPENAVKVVVTDRIPANMALVPGSVDPPATMVPVGGRPDGMLRWVLGVGPRDPPQDLTFTLRPLDVGYWPTNIEAAAVYTESLNFVQRVVYPIPWVEVLAPPTSTPTATPTATATQEPTPTVPEPSPTHTPTLPPPTTTPTATPTIQASATPTGTVASRDIYLPFAERPGCRRAPRPVDVVLLMDTSTSMEGTALQEAKRAAATFVGQLNLRAGADRAALIGFDSTARLAQPLTNRESDLLAAIDGLATTLGTRIDLGLVAATAELTGPRVRGGADRAIVLLTDGRPQGGTEDAVRAAAARARAIGSGIWAVGLGDETVYDVLVEITADPRRVYLAPGTGELEAIYHAIASGIVCR